MATDLAIRPARSSDRPDLERICARTFDWVDYYPEVWDDLLADKVGELWIFDRRFALHGAVHDD